jgi:hypothetical protein
VAFGAKQAIGLSTWFGQLTPGPGLWTYRIWWHFIANVIGSVIFGVALYHLWRERDVIRASFEGASLAERAPGWPGTAPAEPGRLAS